MRIPGSELETEQGLTWKFKSEIERLGASSETTDDSGTGF